MIKYKILCSNMRSTLYHLYEDNSWNGYWFQIIEEKIQMFKDENNANINEGKLSISQLYMSLFYFILLFEERSESLLYQLIKKTAEKQN